MWLPVLAKGDSLVDSMIAMHDSLGCAVLVEGTTDDYSLVYVGNVLEALDRNARTLEEADQGDLVHLATAADATRYRVDLVQPLRTRLQYETLLDAVGASYSVVALARDRALVVTRHESMRELLSHSSTYYCDGSTTHYFPSPIVQVDSDCLKCLGSPKGKIFLKP